MWLRYFYTSFDQENKMIKIAKVTIEKTEPILLTGAIIAFIIIVGLLAIIFTLLIHYKILFHMPNWIAVVTIIKEKQHLIP